MDLTSTGEDPVSQILDESLAYALVTTTANLTGKPSGFTVHLNVTTNVKGYTLLRYVWYRMDTNFHADGRPKNEWYIVSNSTVPYTTDTVSGGPTDPKVQYMAMTYSITQNTLLVQSNVYNFHPKEKLWWLPLVIALPLGLLLIAALIAGFVYSKKKHPEWFAKKPKSANKTKPKAKPKPKSEPNPLFTDVSVAAAAPAAIAMDDPNDPRKPNKQYTVNIDYLMTGAKRVVVKDGNPTSNKKPEDYDSDEESNSNKNKSSASGDEDAEQMDVEKPAKPTKPWIKRLFPCL